MNTIPDFAASEQRSMNDPWVTEVLRIIRRRELAYRAFVWSCAAVCLLLVLAFYYKGDW